MVKKNNFENKRKQEKLRNISLSLSVSSLKDASDDLTKRCKFNFSYCDSTQIATFFNLSQKQQEDLIKALVSFCKESLSCWKTKGRFVIYDLFPPKNKTKFEQPKHIPNDVCWCRFRLSGKFRLVGFTVPEILHNEFHETTGELFDKNTFYVVFIDPEHEFWISR